jgi:hypothetical protein
MRAPERAHKRQLNDEGGNEEGYRVPAVTGGATRLEPMSRASGISCMIMISTQRPIAVSMVAGRVRKTGFGLCARRSSNMADHSKIASSKIYGQAARNNGPSLAKTIKHALFQLKRKG